MTVATGHLVLVTLGDQSALDHRTFGQSTYMDMPPIDLTTLFSNARGHCRMAWHSRGDELRNARKPSDRREPDIAGFDGLLAVLNNYKREKARLPGC